MNQFDVTGQSLINIQSKFINGNVCFTWNFSTSLSSPYVDIMYHKNKWMRVKQKTYTVRDVLLYDTILIDAKDSNVRIAEPWKYKRILIEYTYFMINA